MLATEENKFWSSGEFFDLGDEFDDSTSIDIHTLMEIIGENPGPAQNTPGSLSTEPVSSVESVPDVFRQVDSPLQNGFQELEVKPSLGASLPAPLAFPSSCSSGDSVSGTWYPDGSFLPPQNFMVIDQGKSDSKLPPEILYPFPNCSDSLRLHDTRYLPGLGTSSNVLSSSRIDGQQRQNEMHGRNTISSAGYANQVLDCSDTVHLDCFSNEVKVLDVNLGKSLVAENNIGVLEAPEKYSCTSMEIRIMDKNISGQHATHIQSSFSQSPDSMFQNCHSDMHYSIGDGDNHVADPSTEHFCDGVNDQFVPNCEDNMINIEDDEYVTENPSMQVEAASPIVDLSEIDYSGMMGSYSKTVFNNDIILSPEMSYSDADGEMIGKKELKKLWVDPQSCCKQTTCRKEASISGLTESIPDTLDSLFPNSNSKMAFSGTFPSTSSKRHVKSDMDEEMNAFVASERAPDSQDILDLTAGVTFNAGDLNQTVLGHLSHGSQGSSQFKQFNFIKDEREGEAKQHKNVANHLSKVSPESIQSNSLDEKTLDVDGDDNDICILEDISQPPRSTAYPYRKIITPQAPTFNDSLHDIGTGSMRLRANDEQLVLRHALQDLSQQKEETSPPDGLLAIPLLRHQKIALSWMVHKEVAGWNCVGGILADDQGLGKTISMIALILKERPPSSVVCCKDARQEKKETLNLDEDDEGIVDIDGLKQDLNSLPVTSKGRPAAGTLVVCPTSVIRQWADELHNKVTAKAGLSVLVYHGGNRTKDPCELAKYDVVLTTYSIVSMEVPKQPLVEKDEDGTQIRNADVLSMGMSSSKKRKYPPSSEKGSSKGRKGVDSRFLDICDRPLGKVQWFRVVLDEAQSIKNYRTQVARACWGLRAKRRWCLSGTPIQNAIDDLYSYFRFLKYEPYSVYKAFCEMIKIPINRSPTKGYRKLQAVLKTVMLRRTKGTKIDGEPIITLPAKSIELKKVDFSAEERDFYSKLEADSRAKFQDYADAGTVKQNYVNILLMLLRLRQACDHPLLVRGLDSDSKWKSSVQSARKLSQEKQLFLLHCLEASLAICGICNDPPEDAVVSICGHVFCNQCICQHLTGDDNYCPAASCKIQLNTSSVFSRASLKCSLSDEAGSDNLCSSGSELVEVPEPCYEACSFDSSKIRAALKVLQSLSSPGESESLVNPLRSSGHIDSFSEKFSDTLSENLLEVKLEKKTLSPDKSDKSSSNTLSVVREKAIVFSQWTGMLNLLEACLKNTSIQYRRLDGTMSVAARDKAVKEFNSCPEVSVMLMSLKAASLGLNLVAACHVLLLDLWWNPTTEDQAIDRAHRIGQTRPVTVVRLTVKDTVEDRILALQQKKREMVSSAFGEDETGSKQTRLTVDDLKYLFMA